MSISKAARESMKSDAEIRAENFPLDHPLFETIRTAAIDSNIYHYHVGGMESPLFDEVAKMVIELLPMLPQPPKPKREWFPPSQKPPRAKPVLVKVSTHKPRSRKPPTVTYWIGAHWTPGKDHHDDHESWSLGSDPSCPEHEDIDDSQIIAWSFLED